LKRGVGVLGLLGLLGVIGIIGKLGGIGGLGAGGVAALQCYSSRAHYTHSKKEAILYIFIYTYINIYNMNSFFNFALLVLEL
jgi:hypothetical protein